MAKTFGPWDVDQVWLLPASIDDFVAPEHPAHLVRDIVRGELDLAAILSAYEQERISVLWRFTGRCGIPPDRPKSFPLDRARRF